jgi:hypothetical protein
MPAGRHSYITELLRNGVSVVEARELARHTDVKMTMRYTHIGLADQAKALKRLPEASSPSEAGQHIGRTSCHPTGDDTSRRDSCWHNDNAGEISETPEESRSLVTSWQNKTGDGDSSRHPLKSGGGGNRTRVPYSLYVSFYVRSRPFSFARRAPGRRSSLAY